MDPKISAIAGLILAQTDWKWEKCLQFAFDVQTISDGLDRVSNDPAKRAVVRRRDNEEAIKKDARIVTEHAERNQPFNGSGESHTESESVSEGNLQPVGDETE